MKSKTNGDISASSSINSDGEVQGDLRPMGTRAPAAPVTPPSAAARPQFEIVDCKELGRRLKLPESWIRDQVRRRAHDPLPHLRFGKYVRFRWASPELESWLERRIIGANNRSLGRVR